VEQANRSLLKLDPGERKGHPEGPVHRHLDRQPHVRDQGIRGRDHLPDKNPSHDYTKNGRYTVKLTVRNSGGTSTLVKTNYVRVK
jgi:hypothetical protein